MGVDGKRVKRTSAIFSRVAFLIRVSKSRRHLSAMKESIEAMTAPEVERLRFLVETQLAIFREARLDDFQEQSDSKSGSRVLDALIATSKDRCLFADSRIVRDRYIARWLAHALHLTQGVNDKPLVDIKCQIIGLLKFVRSQALSDESETWFRDYRKTGS